MFALISVNIVLKVPKGGSIRTLLMDVQESGHVLGKIETKTATTPRANLRSVLKAKLAALEMRAHLKDGDIEEILADITKGEKNRNPMEKKYSIQCPSFQLGNCTRTFSVSKKWFDLRPMNSDGTSNQMSVLWSNHFKGLYNTKRKPHLILKMVDNHPRNLYCHHIIKHGGNHFPYLDYDKKNQRSDWIKADSSVRKARHARQLTEINSDTKARRDTGNQAEPDMSVLSVTCYI